MLCYRLGPHAVWSDVALDLTAAAATDPIVRLRRVARLSPRDWCPERDDTAAAGSIRSWRSSTDAGYRLRFAFGDYAADFAIAPDGTTVELAVTGDVPEEHLAWLFQGPVLGRALRLAGEPCLHATVLAYNGRAVGVAGPSGAGKSTLAAALVSAGAMLVGDDLAVIAEAEGRVLVHPGAARLRLWPDSAAHAPSADHAPVLPGVDALAKVSVTLRHAAAAEPQPLTAFYRLTPRRGATVHTRALPPAAAGAAISANIYGALPPTSARLRRELAWSARVASHVPVGELSVPEGHATLAAHAPALLQALFQ